MNFNATLIGQMITFALLVIFTMKYIWPPVIQAMQDRQRRIAEGLASAERGAQEEERARADAESVIREARQQAAEIIAQAQRQANETIQESQQQARTEGDRLKAAAQAEIEQEVARAREALRGKVVGLAVAGAGRVLKQEIDAEAHGKLLEDLAAQI